MNLRLHGYAHLERREKHPCLQRAGPIGGESAGVLGPKERINTKQMSTERYSAVISWDDAGRCFRAVAQDAYPNVEGVGKTRSEAVASLEGAVAKESRRTRADRGEEVVPGSEHVAADEHGISGFAEGKDGAPPSFAISVESYDSPFVLRLHGDMGEDNVAFARDRIRKAVKTFQVKELVCDLSHFTSIESQGLGVLIAIQKELHKHGGHLQLSKVPPRIKRIFEVTVLLTIFTLIE